MGKIDKEKEYIGALKAYLGFILAVILAIGTGLVKLYLNEEFGILFWVGSIVILSAIVLFSYVAKTLHAHIDKLEEL